MIKFVSVEDVLALRSSELRSGKIAPKDMRYPTDNAEGSLHLGYFIKGQLVSILSMHRQHYGQYKGEGYQMRGVATIEQFRGQGIGTKMLNFALIYLQGQKANYLWCNGRKRALKFYQSAGFEIVSGEFELPPAGLHHVLYLKIA
ncbi:GNAT family N-acetyltransferase [Mucilaginibacter antarcticus]|uniref:GNAT family N-acetyltransferase n=1 Tax=Mucilaginibacter antarcticus TaxID=1855725 RepID=A0ABW5XMQ6_9SPHI